MRIIITGSPGTGKSVIAKALSRRLGVGLLDLKQVVRTNKLAGKNHEVDIKKLAGAVLPLARKKDFIAEGHLACEFRIPADFVFVLRTSPAVLRRRLAARHYGKNKIYGNLMAEMLDYCVVRVKNEYKKTPLELDTSGRSAAECASEIEKAIKRKKKKLDSVDYSDELKKQLKLR
jgi:adenylate kinase